LDKKEETIEELKKSLRQENSSLQNFEETKDNQYYKVALKRK